MKSEVLHDKLIAEIKRKLPHNANMAATLSDILSLGKEAVYRRLRGEVPFSFAEVAQISEKLDVSLNDIVGASVSDGALFRLQDIRFLNPRESDYKQFEACINALKSIEHDPYSELGSSSNTIQQHLLIPHPALDKFRRFKWQYQHCFNETAIPFHEVVITEKFQEIEKQFVHGIDMIKTVTYIWDKMIFESMVNDIKYFMRVRLISDEDVKKLKEELYDLINNIEEMAVNGKNALGNRRHIYISNTNFESSYTYVQSNARKLSLLGVFSLNMASSPDEKVFDCLKKWILSLRRVSVLISECGEMQRVLFFRRQRELIDSL